MEMSQMGLTSVRGSSSSRGDAEELNGNRLVRRRL